MSSRSRQGYSADEMRRYWRTHSRLWSDLDRERDPEGLTNVCYNGAPLWLNKFAARCQLRAFLQLVSGTGTLEGRQALDVGCGVGRWSRLLSDLGARVTGVDLQPETLRDNRRRFPACRFLEMDATALAFPDGAFDFAASVTVLQHLPDDAQDLALREVRRVLKGGSYFVMLEGTSDRGPHVFAQEIEGWLFKAETAGFHSERVTFYDYAPLLYALRGLAGRIQGSRYGDVRPMDVEEYVARYRRGPEAGGIGRRAYRMVLRAATLASRPVESVLTRVGPASWAHHAGFLLRAR